MRQYALGAVGFGRRVCDGRTESGDEMAIFNVALGQRDNPFCGAIYWYGSRPTTTPR